jgi:multidrug resistance protein MdtO
LGLLMMWLVFDQLWAAPAAVEMKRTFISSLRLLAQLAREPLPGREKSWSSYALRETISANFDKVRSLADGVLFELGPSRQQDLALRNRIRQWQPQLRMIFTTRIALLKYRLQLPGFELPEAVRVAQQEFDNRAADMLNSMADGLEGKASVNPIFIKETFERLENVVQNCCSGPASVCISAPNISAIVTQNRKPREFAQQFN